MNALVALFSHPYFIGNTQVELFDFLEGAGLFLMAALTSFSPAGKGKSWLKWSILGVFCLQTIAVQFNGKSVQTRIYFVALCLTSIILALHTHVRSEGR